MCRIKSKTDFIAFSMVTLSLTGCADSHNPVWQKKPSSSATEKIKEAEQEGNTPYVREIGKLIQDSAPGVLGREQQNYDSGSRMGDLSFLFRTQAYLDDKNLKLAQQQLSIDEKEYGSKSIFIVPSIIRLIACSRRTDNFGRFILTDGNEPMIDRAVSIAEAATKPNTAAAGEASARAADALATMSYALDGSSCPSIKLKERLLRSALKLSLKASGISVASLSNLNNLGTCLITEGKIDECCALYRMAISFLEKRPSATFVTNMQTDMQLKALRSRLMEIFLMQNRLNEAEELRLKQLQERKQIDEAEKAHLLTQMASTDSLLEKAKEKIEIDPTKPFELECVAASLHFKNNDSDGGVRLFKQAALGYAALPEHDIEQRDSLWNSLQSGLSAAKKKDDEKIIFDYLDATNNELANNSNDPTWSMGSGVNSNSPKNQAQIHIMDIVKRFADLHRTADAIPYLEYSFKKLYDTHPDEQRSLGFIAYQIRELYKKTGATPSTDLQKQITNFPQNQSGE